MSSYMTDSENSKCHAIIHSAATAAGAVGAGLAQLPFSDNLVIMPIQIGMVASLGNVFGKNLGETAIKSLISAAAGTVIGRSASQALLGWVPLLGNAINASTAFAITESIGWAIANNFAMETAKEAEEARKEAELRNIMEEAWREAGASSFSLRTAMLQIGYSIINFLKFIFITVPLGLWKSLVYTVSGIGGALRTFLLLVWEVLRGRAWQVVKLLGRKAWNGICAFIPTAFYGLLAVGFCRLIVYLNSTYNILTPEFESFLLDWLQYIF